MPKMKERGIYLATAVFPNLSLVYFAMAIYTGTLGEFNRYQDKGILTIGGAPCTNSRHPSAPLHSSVQRHPGWELLCYSEACISFPGANPIDKWNQQLTLKFWDINKLFEVILRL